MLAKSIPMSTIEFLDLSRNPLGNNGLAKLCHAFTYNHIELNKLDLSDCSFNFNGAKPLYEFIKKNWTVKYLILDKNNLGGYNVDKLKGALWAN